jgi:uncharacterized repeat protein (TIGR03803 family)
MTFKAWLLAALIAPSVGAASGYQVLYTFNGGKDGGQPAGGLSRDASGNLYGTTTVAGRHYGTAFKLSPAGVATTLFSFRQRDGTDPVGPLLLDGEGALFGTAQSGGQGCNTLGCGTIFEIAPDGSEKTLIALRPKQGVTPAPGLTADASGNLYGMVHHAKDMPNGAIFRLSPQGDFTPLHAFDYDKDGSGPVFGLVADRKGNLYGTTPEGGPTHLGTIFKFTPDGVFTLLHAFSSNDGILPAGRLTLDRAGNLYGALFDGGPGLRGSIYRLAPDGTFTTLYTFTGGADGSAPNSPITLDGRGNLYGTTVYNRAGGFGLVYKFSPSDGLSILYEFSPGAGGEGPVGGLLYDHGHLYGATSGGGADGSWCSNGCGVIYEIGAQ